MNPKRKLFACAVGLALICQECLGFVQPPNIPVLSISNSRLVTTELRSGYSAEQNSFKKSQSNLNHAGPRLSHDEQQELLRQAVETRRLRNLKKELWRPNQEPTLLQLSRYSGYGDEINEYKEAFDRGHAAREMLVTSNMGLVHFTVNNLVGQGRQLRSLSRDDLIQEGAIGLARAVDKWNLEIGGRFSSYAIYWVRAAILRCIAERDDIVRVPEYVSSAVRKVTRAAKSLGLELDGGQIILSPSWKEAHVAKALAEEAGLSDRQLLEALKVKQRRKNGVRSFEDWMQQGREFATDLSSSIDETNSRSLELEKFKSNLSRFLKPREMEALSLRYGLTQYVSTLTTERDYVAEAERELFPSPIQELPAKGRWGEAMSFNEVGKKMTISAEGGRLLCHKALAKLRRAAEDGALEPAFLL
jgi:RNA polymerase sigma factor (sigma-70 family)